VSSGLRSGRLRRPDEFSPQGSVLAPEAVPRPAADRRKPIIIGAAAAGLLLLIVIIVMATRGDPKDKTSGGGGTRGGVTNNNGGGGGGNNNTSVNPPDREGLNDPCFTMTEPNFLGVPVSGPVVILLDRGSGTQSTFEAMKGAAAVSFRSLTPAVHFQVVFWQTDSTLASPASGTVSATPTSIKAVIGQAVAFGSTTIDKPLDLALASKPKEVVLVTGKFGLDSEFSRKVLDKLKKHPGVKVHTFALGQLDSAGPLKEIAQKTGGTFREISAATLKELQDHTISFDSE
jgi:hypothetical protein